MTKEEIISGNKLIAEFMKEGYWQIWKKKEVGGYKPYLADEYITIEKCQEAIDEHFTDKMIGNTLSSMAQHKKNYAPNFITKEYQSVWDWLMPVVEKIEEKGSPYYIEIVETHCYIYNVDKISDTKFQGFIITDAETKIEAVWKSVVEFIKYINKK